jgi:peroxiredoxin
LLSIWGTWCGPCVSWLPAFNRIYTDVKNKGLAMVTIDRDDPEYAAEYLARHNYSWTNYHDVDSSVGRAFKSVGIRRIPLTILIDAQGKIVYDDFGDESAVRKAIAALGPEFAFITAPASGNEPQRRY